MLISVAVKEHAFDSFKYRKVAKVCPVIWPQENCMKLSAVCHDTFVLDHTNCRECTVIGLEV